MTTGRTAAQEVAPKMAELSANVLFGDVWERPELSKRDRSLITVSVLTALYRTGQLPGHLNRALDNGLTKEEIGEAITHVAFYAGWPTAANAVQIAKDVFDSRP
jgi:4-carboxymuconolactone decarboxylase